MPLYRTPASGGVYEYPFAAPAVTGRVYRAPAYQSSGSYPNTVGVLGVMPVILEAGTLDRIYMQHLDTPTADEVFRLGVWADTDGRPGVLVVDGGTVDLSTAAGVKSVTISAALSTTGRYWVGGARQGPTAAAGIMGYGFSNAVNVGMQPGPGWVELPETSTPTAVHDRMWPSFEKTGVTGALPDPFGTPGALVYYAAPMCLVRYA